MQYVSKYEYPNVTAAFSFTVFRSPVQIAVSSSGATSSFSTAAFPAMQFVYNATGETACALTTGQPSVSATDASGSKTSALAQLGQSLSLYGLWSITSSLSEEQRASVSDIQILMEVEYSTAQLSGSAGIAGESCFALRKWPCVASLLASVFSSPRRSLTQ